MIVDLGFKSTVRPELGFELLRYSDLFARRRELPHPIDTLTRPSFYLVAYCRAGRTQHRIDFERCSLARHDLAVVAPGRVQAFDPTPGLELDLVLFTPEFLQLSPDLDPLRGARILSPFWMPPTLHVPKAQQKTLTGLVEQLRIEYANPRDAVQTALLSSLLRAFLLTLERIAARAAAQPSAPAELASFLDALERRHAQTRNVDDYARAIGVSPRTLNALTQRHFGATAKHTIDRRVVLELKRLLAYTDLSVKQLSARFGFHDPTNLVKFFRHHAGTTPLAFRETSTHPV